MATEGETILHSDLNAFYASVETMLDPSLRDKAVAVCGSTETRHGIVLAKSEKAKKAGVKTGMANWQARQACPDLIVVPPQYDQYVKYSQLVHDIYYRYTDLVEPFGMDECWLDVSACRDKTPLQIANEIRTATREELGLTVSVGISFTKVFAKLGSDMKKPDAVTQITRADFRRKVWPLAASEMIYVGPATARRLAYYGIRTIGELAALPPDILKGWFGVNGIALWHFANGTDTSRVAHKDFVSPVKTVGHGVTCTADLNDCDEVYRVMLELSQDVGHRLRVHGLCAEGVQVWVRDNELGGVQYQCRLPCRTQLPRDIANTAFRLFRERYTWQAKVRAVCVRAISLRPASDAEQMSLFVDYAKQDRLNGLQGTIESLRSRFGGKAVTYASIMGDIKIPTDDRDLVRMPGRMHR